MSRTNIELYWEGEEHPPLEVLRLYQEDELPDPLTHQVEEHLLDCTICSDVLEGMVLSDRSQTSAATQHVHHRLKKLLQQPKKKENKFNWVYGQIAAVILVLVCALSVIIYHQYTLVHEKAPVLAQESAIVRETEVPVTPDLAQMELEQETFGAMAEAPAETTTPAAPAATAQEPTTIPPAPRKTFKAPLANRSTTVISEPEAVAENTESEVESIGSISLTAPPLVVDSNEVRASIAAAKARAKNTIPENKESFQTPVTEAKAEVQAGDALIKSLTGRRVSGKVVSDDGQPLPGVNVQVKGITTGVSTGADGTFTVQVPADQQTLTFRYIGFETKEVKLDAGMAALNVALASDNKALSEVVVNSSSRAPAASVVAAKPAIGMPAYKKYLNRNLRYPAEARQQKVRGRVVVSFTVLPDGQLVNVQVQKGLHPACDAEAVRLVTEGPAWLPGARNGAKEAQEVKVSVRFKP